MKTEQTECSEMSPYNIQMLGITQKKAYNMQNMMKVWNQVIFVLQCFVQVFILQF